MAKKDSSNLDQPAVIDDGKSSDFWPQTQRPFVDKLLLAIIRAHPQQAHSGEEKGLGVTEVQRLSAAKEALFNIPRTTGNDERDDFSALDAMAYWYSHDRGGLELALLKPRKWKPKKARGVRTIRQLAREAVRLTTGNSKEAIEERLRKKFTRALQALLTRDMFLDNVEESLEAQSLLKVRKILREWGIDSKDESIDEFVGFNTNS